MLNTNKSLIYPILLRTCEISQRLSGLGFAKRLFGRYVAVEFLVLLSVMLGLAALLLFDALPQWLKIGFVSLYMWRVLTMALGQVGILLLNLGKSTPGERIHSRIRYLFLAVLNFYEVVLLGTLGTLILDWTKNMGGLHFSPGFDSKMEAVYYNFQLASGLGATSFHPTSTPGIFLSMLVSSLGFLMLAVVLSIILAIQPEDEVVGREIRPEGPDYWSWRALKFANSAWATSNELRAPICAALKGKKINSVVDVGCGAGHLCNSLAGEGFDVTGIDSSEGMVKVARRRSAPGVNIQKGEALSLPLPDHSADAVVMRMLLHNVMPQWRPAIKEAKRVLKPGGLLLIVEGFPPSEDARSFFSDVTNLIHKRHTFTEEQLRNALESSGFKIEKEESIIYRQMSVTQWVQESTGDESVWAEVVQRHMSMPAHLKSAYSATLSNKDVLIDIHFKMLVAHQPFEERK